MEFPITELLDDEASPAWLEAYFHPEGIKCPQCGAPVSEARYFRRTKRSQLTVYRCQRCEQPYNLYSGTVLQQRHLRPAQ